VTQHNDIERSASTVSGFATGLSAPRRINVGAKNSGGIKTVGVVDRSSAAHNSQINSSVNNVSFTPFGVTMTGISQQILPGNRRRVYLMLQNNSASPVHVGFGSAVNGNLSNAYTISAGGFYELDVTVPYNTVYVTGGAGLILYVCEGTVSDV